MNGLSYNWTFSRAMWRCEGEKYLSSNRFFYSVIKVIEGYLWLPLIQRVSIQCSTSYFCTLWPKRIVWSNRTFLFHISFTFSIEDISKDILLNVPSNVLLSFKIFFQSEDYALYFVGHTSSEWRYHVQKILITPLITNLITIEH